MNPWTRRLLLIAGAVVIGLALAAMRAPPAERCVRLLATVDSMEVFVHDPPCRGHVEKTATDRLWKIDAELAHCAVFVQFSTEHRQLAKRNLTCDYSRRTEAR